MIELDNSLTLRLDLILINHSFFIFFYQQRINKIKGILQGYPNPYTVPKRRLLYHPQKKLSFMVGAEQP